MPWKSEDARQRFIMSLPLELGSGVYGRRGSPVCAIGHVAHAVTGRPVYEAESWVKEAVAEVFGLSSRERRSIEGVNDDSAPTLRRARVIEACMMIPVEGE